jgi:hypothetical protein
MNIDNYPKQHVRFICRFANHQKDTPTQSPTTKALAVQDNADTKRKLNTLKASSFCPEQELHKYTGIFIIEEHGVAVTLQVRNGAIWAIVPGQNDSELVAISPDTFSKKDENGYTISFKLENGKATSFISVQPNGIFKAYLKK